MLRRVGVAGVILGCLVVLAVAPPPPKPATGFHTPTPKATINLDLPEEERWLEVVSAHQTALQRVLNTLQSDLPFGNATISLLEQVLAKADSMFGDPYTKELTGVAKAANVSLGLVALMQLYYELTSACTSIIAAQSNGTTLHCRNLDYTVDGLEAITIQLDFLRGGQVAYSGVTYVGYIGLLTGVRPNAFSVSVDERWTANGTIWDNVKEALLGGGKSIGMFLRSTLDTQTSYEAALKSIISTPLISVEYIIVAGVSNAQGAVVTRNRTHAIDVWSLDPPHGRWFEVETNYDHWKAPEHGDDRRTPANKRMNMSSPSDISMQYLFSNVLNLFPSLNSETTYTACMRPLDGELWSFVQNTPPTLPPLTVM